jgi:hypothetical protein
VSLGTCQAVARPLTGQDIFDNTISGGGRPSLSPLCEEVELIRSVETE